MIRVNISHSPTAVSVFNNDKLVETFIGNLEGTIPSLVDLVYDLGSKRTEPTKQEETFVENDNDDDLDMVDEGSPSV